MLTYALLYRSRAVRPLTETDLAQLALRSASQNASDAVTGLLLYAEPVGSEGLFVQWVEGAESAVVALYERIREDPRHTDCEVIAEGP